MKTRIREISIALWATLAAASGGCAYDPAPPETASAAAPTQAAVPPLAGSFDGLDEAVMASLFE